MLKPCAKRSAAPGSRCRRDLLVDGRLHLVREQERDELRVPPPPRRATPTARPASSAAARELLPVAEPDDDVDSGVVQVERVRVPLAAVAEHGDLAGEQAEIAVAVDCRHEWDPLLIAGRFGVA